MAAFAAAVKIDAFAYLPVQDFGNAFSIFISQNYGAGKTGRIRKGIRTAMLTTVTFGLALSALVWVLAAPLMGLFIDDPATAGPVIAEGRALPAYRGRLLCPDRRAVPAVRALPRPGPPRS